MKSSQPVVRFAVGDRAVAAVGIVVSCAAIAPILAFLMLAAFVEVSKGFSAAARPSTWELGYLLAIPAVLIVATVGAWVAAMLAHPLALVVGGCLALVHLGQLPDQLPRLATAIPLWVSRLVVFWAVAAVVVAAHASADALPLALRSFPDQLGRFTFVAFIALAASICSLMAVWLAGVTKPDSETTLRRRGTRR